MKCFAFCAGLALAACGGTKPAEIKITVAGVSIGDLASIKSELVKIKGVSDVKAGQFKEGKVSLTLNYTGKGGDLAAILTAGPSGLKNVKAFDDGSIDIVYGAAAPPPAPAEAIKKVESVKAPEPVAPPPQADPARLPLFPVAEAPTPARKEPLAYRPFQIQQGTMATFDNWKVTPVPGAQPPASMYTQGPGGRENDFTIVVLYSPPGNEQGDLFQTAPMLIQRQFPALQMTRQQVRFAIGGDDAALEEYQTQNQGKTIVARCIYVKRKEVSVVTMGVGEQSAFNEFVKSINIVAASVTLGEARVPVQLVGTWGNDREDRAVTICPNGTFLARTGNEMVFGKMQEDAAAKTLAFAADGAKEWRPSYRFEGDGLILEGVRWSKR